MRAESRIASWLDILNDGTVEVCPALTGPSLQTAIPANFLLSAVLTCFSENSSCLHCTLAGDPEGQRLTERLPILKIAMFRRNQVTRTTAMSKLDRREKTEHSN